MTLSAVRTASGPTSSTSGLLHLAATTGERRVEAALRARLAAGAPCEYAGVRAEVRPAVPALPAVHVPRPDLAQYDALISGGGLPG